MTTTPTTSQVERADKILKEGGEKLMELWLHKREIWARKPEAIERSVEPPANIQQAKDLLVEILGNEI